MSIFEPCVCVHTHVYMYVYQDMDVVNMSKPFVHVILMIDNSVNCAQSKVLTKCAEKFVRK